MKRFLYIVTSFVILLSTVTVLNLRNTASASREDIIADAVFWNTGSMNESQIDNFINAFPNSCLKPSNYPSNLSPVTWNEPLGYFDYGGATSPARIIWRAANLYSINPQVILATLEKEQGLVSGNTVWGSCQNATKAYNSAMGYNCPDGSENALKDYPSIGVSRTCVAKESNVTFSRQVNHAAWQLSFDSHRAYGDLNWLGDNVVPYVGFMTQGQRARVQGGPTNYYDGLITIDGVSFQVVNGATAALYNYTPHFNSFERIFTQWFGDSHMVSLPQCNEATGTALDCIWYLYSPAENVNAYTNSDSERFDYLKRGYQLTGKQFFGTVPAGRMSGQIPLYRVKRPSGDTFLTTDFAEKNLLVNIGGQDQGIVTYVDLPNKNNGYPVYRFFNPTTNKHRWVTTTDEINALYSQGFQSEGSPFTYMSTAASEPAPPDGMENIYRFYIGSLNDHFWTNSVAERDDLIRRGYQYEHIAWHGSTNTNDQPVYRLFSYITGQHLYTTSQPERDYLVGTNTWRDEGITQYVSRVQTNTPVYRLYSPHNNDHLLTLSAPERDYLVSVGSYRYEGIAWYQP